LQLCFRSANFDIVKWYLLNPVNVAVGYLPSQTKLSVLVSSCGKVTWPWTRFSSNASNSINDFT